MNPYPNLKILRLQNNYKQEYVADTLGISQPEYSKLESGQRKLDAANIRNLCNLYDVTSDQLLYNNNIAGGARSSTKRGKSKKSRVTDSAEAPNDNILMKMMENYNYILESYLQQQKIQQKILDKMIGEQPLPENTEEHPSNT